MTRCLFRLISVRRSRSFVARVVLLAASSLVLLGSFGCQTPGCLTCDGNNKEKDKELEIQRGKDSGDAPIASPIAPNTTTLDAGAVEIPPTDGSGNLVAADESLPPGKVKARQTAGVSWMQAPSATSAMVSSDSPAETAPISESTIPANGGVSNDENAKEAEELTSELTPEESKEESPDLPLKANEYAAANESASAVENVQAAATTSDASVQVSAPTADASVQVSATTSDASVQVSAPTAVENETPESGAEENKTENKEESSADSDDDSFVGASAASFQTAALERRVPASTSNNVRSIPRTVAFKTTAVVKPAVSRVFASNVDPSTFGGEAIDASSRSRSIGENGAVPASDARRFVSVRTFGYEYATVRTDER